MARTWTGVIARLGVPTGDDRIIVPGGLTNRDLPLPLMWQELSSDGHGGSSVVGAIESVDYSDAGVVRASGRLLDSAPTGVVEQLEAGVIGPSVDLDDVEYTMDDAERIVITRGRIAGATLVSIPAFADVGIDLDADMAAEAMDDASWLMASAAPALPDASWFTRPDLDRLTPVTVSDTGRVFGHIAGWESCHVGLPGCVTPPVSMTDYGYFHQSSQRLADGRTLPVGVLVAGPRHADPQAAFHAAMQHYDDPAAKVAKVVAGEDEFGIWVAGWILPEARPEAVETFMSSPVSGDWRLAGGHLELIAVCSVNSAGFPIPRARVAFSHQEGQRTLIGTFGITPLRGSKPDSHDAGPGENDGTLRARWAWHMTTEG